MWKTWIDRRNDKNSDRSAIGVENCRYVVVRLGDEHVNRFAMWSPQSKEINSVLAYFDYLINITLPISSTHSRQFS
jgi:hypothetical protein